MPIPAPDNREGHFVRTKDFVSHYKLYSDLDHNVFADYDITVTRVTDEWSKSDTDRHDWRIVQGIPWRDPTNYTRKVSKYTYEEGFLKRVYSPNPEWVREELSGIWLSRNPRDWNPDILAETLGILPTDGHYQVIVECLLKLNKGKVQLGTYLAETRQAAESIAHTGTDLLNLLLAVKRGQFNRVPNLFGLARKGRDMYLEWQFGWKPLCSDLHDMYTDMVNRAPIAPHLHATRTVKTPFEFDTKFGDDDVEVRMKHTDQCKLFASLSSELIGGLQNHQLINPLSLGWELIPYSFVVDWFAPIGNSLAALTATAGLDFVGGFVSQTRSGTSTIKGTVGSVEKESFLFIREALTDFPGIGFYGRQNPLSLDKAEKLLALLSQLV
jgi:hypothetical protein